MWKTSKTTSLITTVPLLAVGIGFLYLGFTASPDALTDDGYSLQNFYYIMGGFFLIGPLITTLGISLFYKRANDKEIYLTQNGVRGEAEILHRERTGTYINELPQVKFLLQITTSEGESYQMEYKDVISMLDLGSINVGAKLPVFVDPDNPKNILLVYN